MSVINSVLKDLENRDTRFMPIEIETLPRGKVSRADRRPLVLIALLAVALVLAAGFIVYQQARLQAVPPAADAAPPAVGQAVVAAVETPDAAPIKAAVAIDIEPSNQIRELQISENETEMRMEFVLGERTVVFLRERGEHYFSYHLRDIENRVEAPLLRDNPWIVALDLVKRDDGVDVNFETAADVLVETRQTRVDGDVLWAITLRQSESPAPVAATAPPVSRADPVIEPRAEPMAPAEIVLAREDVTSEIETIADVTPAEPDVETTPPSEVRLDIRSSNPRALAADRLSYAVELMNSRRHTEAETLLRGMLGGEADVTVREHLLALYAGQGLADRYARLAHESMLLHPARPLFATEYARTLLQAGSYRAAIEVLRQREALDADQQALLAASYQRLDRHESAVYHYRLALAEADTDARNWVGLAISLEHTAALADALDAYRRAGRLGQLNESLRAFVARRSESLQQVLN